MSDFTVPGAGKVIRVGSKTIFLSMPDTLDFNGVEGLEFWNEHSSVAS